MKADLLFVSSLLTFISSVSGIAITGVSAGIDNETGAVPFRQELNGFRTSGAPFDLYMLALIQFQENNQTDDLSYFQIAGIHGYPYTAWDGVEGYYSSGYCRHNSVLFPTWHRPYLALVEQTIWSIAQDIAAQYPADQLNEYVAAAETLRIPYWDWAAKAEMPDIMTEPTVYLNTPTGYYSVNNPLYTYEFNPLPAAPTFPSVPPVSNYVETYRSPISSSPETDSNTTTVQTALSRIAAQLTSLTYQILTSETNYTVMATDALQDRGGSYNSLEAIHSNIHIATGGVHGHMYYIPFSAFDPVFWLHHANVDRIFAMWQAINPNSYVQPWTSVQNTFTTKAGYIEQSNSPLAPFHSDDSGTFWTSDSARSLATFGYSYPEINYWNTTPAQLASNVRSQVNNLYNPTGGDLTKRAAQSLRLKNAKDVSRRNLDKNGIFKREDNSTTENTTAAGFLSISDFHALGINNLDQWVVNVRVNKYALAQSFTIFMFFGSPPTDSTTWSAATNLVGIYAGFAMAPTAAANSLNQTLNDTMVQYNGQAYWRPDLLAYGQVPITHGLVAAIQAGLLTSLDAAEIVPFLSANLNWGILDSEGCVVPAETMIELGNFSALVGARCVTPAPSGAAADVFPTYGDWEMYPAATVGKAGGATESCEGSNQW